MLHSIDAFLAYLAEWGVQLPFDAELQRGPDAPLATSLAVQGHRIGNRFAVLPMEGWDCTADGLPTEATFARWRAFGRSGAKLLWTESAAVRKDACSSPTQLILNAHTVEAIARLRETAVAAHAQAFGRTDDLHIGLQLTHAGRLSRHRADGVRTPFIAHHHPFLDPQYGLTAQDTVASDDEIETLIDDFVASAVLAAQAGFQFVDIKSCHGYFGHEILCAKTRTGAFGGSLENRTRFIREIVQRAKARVPTLQVAVRASVFDGLPYQADESGVGQPVTYDSYPFGFGCDLHGQLDLTEPIEFVRHLYALGVHLVCLSGGSPYKNWHLQRPQLAVRAGEYLSPEEPLLGVARHIAVTAALKQACPELTVVGSGYSYLQQWLPNVARAAVRLGLVDVVGVARILLTQPTVLHQVLSN